MYFIFAFKNLHECMKKYWCHFLFGLFSFSLSNSSAKLNCLATFLMAGLPSSSKPRGSFPSGEIFFIFKISSESSLRVENILFILATDYILVFILSSFFDLPSFITVPRSTPSTLSSSTSLHFLTMVISMLLTFSARKGRDQEKTFRPSGRR